MAKYGMAINLDKCVGCGTCAIACKTENNTQAEDLVNGRKYNWADFIAVTSGTFPSSTFKVIPVLCNHCTNAACVAICPVSAMTKTADNITMHDDDLCIGCQQCISACPYSDGDVNAASKQYSVLSYNPASPNPHAFWEGTTAYEGSTPDEVATAAGAIPPFKHDFTHNDYYAVRPTNVTEKCYFCDLRVQQGDNPYCVDSCPSGARIFGDLDDPASYISLILAANGYRRLESNTDSLVSTNPSTDPNVYYIGGFNGSTGVDEVVDQKDGNEKLLVYPNPVKNVAKAEFNLLDSSSVSISLFDISGKEVQKIANNEFRLVGKHEVSFNVSDLKGGTYICRLVAGKTNMVTNIVVTK